MVKKIDMTVDQSCEDCGIDLVSALESFSGNLQVMLTDDLVTTNTYSVQVDNVITPHNS